MQIKNAMSITVELSENSFRAKALINCPYNSEKKLSFLLNNDLMITSIAAKHCNISFEKTAEINPSFRPLSQQIVITSDNVFTEISIEYCGSVQFDFEKRKNWYNIITKEFVSLSWYSVWYPQDISIEIDYDQVIIENGHKWFVVKANYNETDNTWEYGNQGFEPYNIIAYCKSKMQVISNPYMSIYFLDDNIKEQALKSQQIYSDIIEFYNGNLFDKRVIPFIDVPCSYPFIKIGGGYLRKGLIWCVSPGNNDLEIAWLYAHEMAHTWCSGANAESWEDWLNETTAEWSSLLYALNKNNIGLFEFILKPKTDKYKSLPKIKTNDGSRPEGVHDKGTVLFYNIYQKFGYETMVKILQCFNNLTVKTTNSFLVKLKSIGLDYVAEMIDVGINN